MLIKVISYLTLILFHFSQLKAVSNQQKILSKTEFSCQNDEEFCYSKDSEYKKSIKYLFYDINPVEGFNLRRDVYIRIANLVGKINSESENFRIVLVLPPWNNLYHWKNMQVHQSRLKWSHFFDLEKLNEYIPVIELETLLKRNEGSLLIDQVFYLESNHQNLGKEEFNRIEFFQDCENTPYYKEITKVIGGEFWSYSEQISAKQCQKVSFRGTNHFLAKHLIKIFSNLNHLMIDRSEVMIHEEYGQSEYWKCRKSMKYSENLIQKAFEFRTKYLNNSTDQFYSERNSVLKFEGNYIGVHIRRGDFVKYRRTLSILKISQQIKNKLDEMKLNQVFIATDGNLKEFNELKGYLSEYQVVRYTPDLEELKKFKDGGVSIIDQLICAYSKFFIGTKESTFSLRIQEERELLGFDESTTFNCFCEEEKICQTSKWVLKL
ncbi:unnamed protein product [Brachionus calyciflorus]|uniref:GDP-fucose protein O-fucosyltransferase 2 n=1 Tax=Brachionus calyciflorus TaxID=104777 RepID=A0A813MAQ6_9BILA|nr:unnamed protein product [Brachionus calyciflorus]